MGQAAIEYLETHKPAPEKWISDQNQKLNAMEKPSGEVILAAVRPVRILLKALEQPVAKTDRPLH